jgi:hypothetical protein
MSNLGCECGNVIHDSGEPIPNKAHLLPDQALDALWEALAAELGSFAESLRTGPTHLTLVMSFERMGGRSSG